MQRGGGESVPRGWIYPRLISISHWVLYINELFQGVRRSGFGIQGPHPCASIQRAGDTWTNIWKHPRELRETIGGETTSLLVSKVTRKVSHVAMNLALLIRKTISNYLISRCYVNYSSGRFLDLLYFDLYSLKDGFSFIIQVAMTFNRSGLRPHLKDLAFKLS